MNTAATVMTFAQLASTIRERAAGPRSSCRVVGVDGMSGAGKTSFARRLADELGASYLCTDELVPGWDGLATSVELLADWVLRPLARGRTARWQRYDWLADRPGEWAEISHRGLLVVEGCCVGLPPAAGYLSFLIWIDTPAAERRQRLRSRDDWDVYAPFIERWAHQEEELHAGVGSRARADLVVDNSVSAPGGGWRDYFAASDVRSTAAAPR